jgi:hypothetical protein
MKKFAAHARAILNRPRVVHYLDIFVAGTGTALYFERDKILGAHGLNAVGCLVFGAAVAGGKAVIEAYRKSVPAIPTTESPTKTK